MTFLRPVTRSTTRTLNHCGSRPVRARGAASTAGAGAGAGASCAVATVVVRAARVRAGAGLATAFFTIARSSSPLVARPAPAVPARARATVNAVHCLIVPPYSSVQIWMRSPSSPSIEMISLGPSWRRRSQKFSAS